MYDSGRSVVLDASSGTLHLLAAEASIPFSMSSLTGLSEAELSQLQLQSAASNDPASTVLSPSQTHFSLQSKTYSFLLKISSDNKSLELISKRKLKPSTGNAEDSLTCVLAGVKTGNNFEAELNLFNSNLNVLLTKNNEKLTQVGSESIPLENLAGKLEKCYLKLSSNEQNYQLLLTSSDQSLVLIQDGAVKWHREEALAQIIASDFFELPADSLFNLEETKGYPSFFERIGPQLEYLTHSVTGLLSLSELLATENAELRFGNDLEREEVDGLRMDQFGFRKLLTVVTKAGKVFALNTVTGMIVSRVTRVIRVVDCRLVSFKCHMSLSSWVCPDL